jgi:hypothetical protein
MLWLLLDREGMMRAIEFYDPVAFWISDFIPEYDGFPLVSYDSYAFPEEMTQPLTIKEVISEDEADILLSDEFFSDYKCLSETIR